MPRYVVERTISGGFPVDGGSTGADQCRALIDRNLDEAVIWLHSYVSEDAATSFCVYEGPSPEAIRRAAARNHLTVERITQVRVLDPYFY
jgi:hypothetical protein